MTRWDFDAHRARMERSSRVVRRVGFAIMAFAGSMMVGCIFAAAYIFSTVSLDDLARRAGELTRIFEDAAQ